MHMYIYMYMYMYRIGPYSFCPVLGRGSPPTWVVQFAAFPQMKRATVLRRLRLANDFIRTFFTWQKYTLRFALPGVGRATAFSKFCIMAYTDLKFNNIKKRALESSKHSSPAWSNWRSNSHNVVNFAPIYLKYKNIHEKLWILTKSYLQQKMWVFDYYTQIFCKLKVHTIFEER